MARRGWLIALWSLSFVVVYGAGFAVVCITNIGPLLTKPETYGLAFMNTVLLVFMTNIFSEAGVTDDPWKKAATLFLGFLFFFGAYYNSVNGVSEGRDKAGGGQRHQGSRPLAAGTPRSRNGISSTRQFPAHPPAAEEQYTTKLKARDDANALRDAQCKEKLLSSWLPDRARALQTCESSRTKAENAREGVRPCFHPLGV